MNKICFNCGRQVSPGDGSYYTKPRYGDEPIGAMPEQEFYHHKCKPADAPERPPEPPKEEAPPMPEQKEQLYRLKPRNDFVIVRREIIEKVRDVYMPQSTAEGQRFVVEAMGKDVKELEVGDEVRINGQEGVHWSPIPHYPDKIIVRQECVILILVPITGDPTPFPSAYEQATEDHVDFRD